MDRITIINRALARIGCLPIISEADPGPAGTGLLATHDSVIDDILSKHPWRFTLRFAALNRLADAPASGWKAAFALPPDRLALPRAYYETRQTDRPVTRFSLTGSSVETDTDTLFCDYQSRALPIHWPAYFSELAVMALAAEYALEIREEPALRDRLRRDAYGPPDYQGEGGQFKVAADLDAQAGASQQVAGGANPLTDVRHGWGGLDARDGWDD
jgi:hypothetical protein